MTKASMLTATALAAMLAGAPVIASAAIVGGTSNTAQPAGTPNDSGLNEGQQSTTVPSATRTNQATGNVTTGSNQAGMNSSPTGMNSSQTGMNSNSTGMSSQSGTDQQLSQNTIQDVQQKLQQDGFYKNGHIDGIMGPQTHQALQQFQQAKGLQSSGQLDQQTMAALGVNAQGNTSANGG